MQDSILPGQPPATTSDAVAAGLPVPVPAAPSIQLDLRPRLWPAVLLVVTQWVLTFIGFRYFQQTMVQFVLMFMGPVIGTLIFIGWWLFASRVPSRYTLSVLGVAVLAAIAVLLESDESFGAFGLILYGLPTATTAWTVWLLASYAMPWRVRYVGLIVSVVLAFESFMLVRLDKVYGNFAPVMRSRFTVPDEDRYLAERDKIGTVAVTETAPLRLQPGDRPGFRGPHRDGKLTGVRIATDWDVHAPKELWKHRIGNAWSSFAVIGDRLYTQEQVGETEAVICYKSDTGKRIWEHKNPGRFTNMKTAAGIGPRATPTFHKGKIYALGATGILNCLDADTGAKIWSRDVKVEGEAKEPTWGFASSPLIAEGKVIVFAGGAKEDKAVVAYHADSGEPAWTAGAGEQLSYCSPQLVTLGGVDQVLLTSNAGLMAINPKTGAMLWTFNWSSNKDVRVVQPAQVDDSDILIGTGFTYGTKRIHVERDGSKWVAKEVWHSRDLNSYFNDQVVHNGYLYGLDNGFLTCIDLKNGKTCKQSNGRKWRTRGDDEGGDVYGNGQLLLLADQDLLLILCEKGEVALVEANPAEYKEVSRFKAIDGLAWNHPVVAHGRLYVRSDNWAGCFQLTEAKK